MRNRLLIFCTAAALTGCMVGPNYRRPAVVSPPQFRAAQTPATESSLGDTKWFDLFHDAALRDLIQQALDANYDIRIAAARVLQAEGQLLATRSFLFPQLSGPGGISRNGIQAPIQSQGAVGYGSSWELDFFGKLRRASEAARADLLAADESKRAVIQELVAQVATAYFDLLEYDAELDYVRESIRTREESVRLVSARLDGGVSTELDLDQAKTLVASAQANAATLEKAQEQTENLINFLLGRDPGPVTRGLTLIGQRTPPEVPAGLPGALLERRPDLRAAEQQLIAANARVGVAKAAFYPSITLTGVGGIGTSDLLGIATRSGPVYSMGAILDLPIFDAGRRAGNYKTAQGRHEELLISYQKAIHGAFRDVSDALIGYQKNKEYTRSQTELAETLRHQSRLANVRYIGGVSSYLEVLDTERQRLTAEQQLAQAQRDVLASLVQVYKSLGGGWQ
jgi:multidrug efflux system outer membrane protein